MSHPRPASPRALRVALAASFGLLAAIAAPTIADAFCGFYVAGADAQLYNDATVVVMMRDGTRTVLSMQNDYQGPPEDFALIIPVPVVLQEEDVKTLPAAIFDRVDKLAAPRLVEYWEQDPCMQPVEYDMQATGRGGNVPGAPTTAVESEEMGVTIEAQFTVGEYEIVILSAKDSTGLDTWLRANDYSIPPGAEPLLRPYVESGMKFFVAKVDTEKVTFETQDDGTKRATLSPLRFHYDSEQFALPVRLGLINAKGPQDLIVHILARKDRYQVANYPNVTIPTNFDVKDGARERFGPFYVSLFDHTLAQNEKAVVTEYSWSAGSCDPCPEPALSLEELVTLGADVLPAYADSLGQGAGSGPNSDLMWSVPSEFVLTRLHARYDAKDLGEDLVFETAPPIAGGREFLQKDGVLERGAVPQPGGQNQFQARYAIRHPWTGPVECKNPKRGIWGGPLREDGSRNEDEPQPTVARKLAAADRSANLGSFVTTSAGKLLGVAVAGEDAGPGEAEGQDRDQGQDRDPAAKGEGPAKDPADAERPAGENAPEEKADGAGCRCGLGDDGPGAPAPLGLGLLALCALARVRRRS